MPAPEGRMKHAGAPRLPIVPISLGQIGSGTRGAERVVPSLILEDTHHPSIWQRLNSLACNVDVPGSVLHHDEELGRVGLDTMLPPV